MYPRLLLEPTAATCVSQGDEEERQREAPGQTLHVSSGGTAPFETFQGLTTGHSNIVDYVWGQLLRVGRHAST